MEPIRVLVADDHALVRAGICNLLQNIPGIEVVGQACDGLQAIQIIATLNPQVVLMDIKMPGLDGLKTTARISKEFPEVRVVILSMYDSEQFILPAIKSGAVGYLLKDSNAAALETAIRSAAAGDTYVSSVILKNMMNMLSNVVGQTNANSNREVSPLTRRQQEILHLIVEGKTTKVIAIELNISPKTVETHRTQLMEKLGINNIPDLVRYAMQIQLENEQEQDLLPEMPLDQEDVA